METDKFMKAFDRSLLGLALLLILGPFRWPLYLDPYWKKAYKKVHAFVDKRVQRAIEKQRLPETQSEGPKKYVLLEEMAKITQDPYDLRMQIINAFFPAQDTAAIAFSDIIFELARHPYEWSKLKAEVDGIDPAQALTFEFLRSLKVTKSIIDESLRLHPAASRIARAALRDSVLPRGGGLDGKSPTFLPKGTIVEMDLYTVQRDPSFRGSDSEEFKTSRWTEPKRPLWEAKWQYELFLGGIRMCPAQNQVLTQVSYLLVRLAREVRSLENRDEMKGYQEHVTMTVDIHEMFKRHFLPLTQDRSPTPSDHRTIDYPMIPARQNVFIYCLSCHFASLSIPSYSNSNAVEKFGAWWALVPARCAFLSMHLQMRYGASPMSHALVLVTLGAYAGPIFTESSLGAPSREDAVKGVPLPRGQELCSFRSMRNYQMG